MPPSRWSLRDDTPTAAALKNAEAKPLGRQTLKLVSVVASLKAESLRGARVEARGLLYREPAYADLEPHVADPDRTALPQLSCPSFPLSSADL